MAPTYRASVDDHRSRCPGSGGDGLRFDAEPGIPYFPDLVVPIMVGGFGIGVISVVLPLCAVTDVGPREIGPVSAVTLMTYNLGGPVMLVVIQAVQTSRTLYLGGTTGPVAQMTSHELDALDAGLHLFAAVGGRGRGRGRG